MWEAGESRTEIVVETTEGTLSRVVSRNGKPLTESELQEDDHRILRLIHDPRGLKNKTHERNSDWQETMNLVKMLPDSLLYTWNSEDDQTLCLGFRPNPAYVSHTIEGSIFRAMNGHVLVNKDQRRLAEMSGQLSNDVEFGWGIFGKLNKGGTFSVRQEQVESGQWEVTFIDVHITGRAWFFKTIGDQRQESCRGFQRVPDSTT